MCNGLVLIASQSCYHLAVFLQKICHMKKCQKCSKPATVHITEIEKHTPNEIHLCETHAQQYLSPGEEQPAQNTAVSILAQYLSTGTVELEQREIKSTRLRSFSRGTTSSPGNHSQRNNPLWESSKTSAWSQSTAGTDYQAAQRSETSYCRRKF